MIVVADVVARYESTLSTDRFEAAARDLLILVEERALPYYRKKYERAEFTVEIEIEVGSTKARVRVNAVVAIFLLYGGLRQVADYLASDAKFVKHEVVPLISTCIGLGAEPPVRVDSSAPAAKKIEGLFRKVERHQMSPEEATHRALELMGAEPDEDSNAFAAKLCAELRSAAVGTMEGRISPHPVIRGADVPKGPPGIPLGQIPALADNRIPSPRVDRTSESEKPTPIPQSRSTRARGTRKVTAKREGKRGRIVVRPG